MNKKPIIAINKVFILPLFSVFIIVLFVFQSASANILKVSKERLSGTGFDIQYAKNETFHAINQEHNFHITFNPEGISIQPLQNESGTPHMEWGLALSGYGYSENIREPKSGILSSQGNLITYQRGSLTEWYVNNDRGLKQGFTLQTQPQGQIEQNVILELTLSGSLTPNLSNDRSAIQFSTTDGKPVLLYNDLIVYDAKGKYLPAEMHLKKNSIVLTFMDTGAVYPITVDPNASCYGC